MFLSQEVLRGGFPPGLPVYRISLHWRSPHPGSVGGVGHVIGLRLAVGRENGIPQGVISHLREIGKMKFLQTGSRLDFYISLSRPDFWNTNSHPTVLEHQKFPSLYIGA